MTAGAGRVALVTGAARGIGRACAKRLARDGHELVIVDMGPTDDCVQAIEAAGGVARGEGCDLSSTEEIQNLCERVGHVDVLVNNAAHLVRREFGELDIDTWRRIQAVGVDAPFLLCAALVPGMAERGFGRVINILSNTIWDPPPVGVLAYVASKGGLLGFTRALAREVGDSGITVNGVAPGLTRTPATAADVPQEQFDAVRDGQAIKRTLEPGDIAGAVAFLASDDAAMITGQALRVDGGTVTL
jgi:NAD(P)-dependent dehydrogenase (short-subunit alcohol dehydrogenase family)